MQFTMLQSVPMLLILSATSTRNTNRSVLTLSRSRLPTRQPILKPLHRTSAYDRNVIPPTNLHHPFRAPKRLDLRWTPTSTLKLTLMCLIDLLLLAFINNTIVLEMVLFTCNLRFTLDMITKTVSDSS